MPKKSEMVPIQLAQPFKRGWVQLRIVGVTPLVVHNKQGQSMRQMLIDRALGKKVTNRGKVRDFHQEFLDSMYINEKGEHCTPTNGIKKGIVAAAGSDVTGANIAMTKLYQLLSINPGVPWTPLEPGHSEPIMHESVVNIGKPPQTTPDIRYRAMYMEWSQRLVIGFPCERMTIETLIGLVSSAGEVIGQCEGRPEKQSGFDWGRWVVEDVEADESAVQGSARLALMPAPGPTATVEVSEDEQDSATA